MGRRCTNCGRYPFCFNIDGSKVAQETDCEKWIKRSLSICIKQPEKQVVTRKSKFLKHQEQKEQLTVGATKFDKGDLTLGEEWLIEAKTCMEEKKSFSIKKEWLEKLKQEQFATSKMYSTLCFDFGDNKNRYYIIEEEVFIYLKELLDKELNS